MSPSAETTASIIDSSVGGAKPVSRLFVMSCARSRSSNTSTSTSMPRSASCFTLAAASRSASIRVERGVREPGRDDGDARVVIAGSFRVAAGPNAEPASTAAAAEAACLVGRAAGEVVAAVRVRDGTRGASSPYAARTRRGVGRGIRNLGGAVLRELLAQHRHDLAAEQVELLEHGLQRQAGVVDEEQLALVVADVVAEAGVRSMTSCGLPTVSGVICVKSSRLGPWP